LEGSPENSFFEGFESEGNEPNLLSVTTAGGLSPGDHIPEQIILFPGYHYSLCFIVHALEFFHRDNAVPFFSTW
jgi:hypothetical protein